MSFKVGDVVKLKSGGPEMTVSEPPRQVIVAGKPVGGLKPGEVFCKWFKEGEEDKPKRAFFNQEELERCNE